jgi:hemerythrin superfamily protein
MSIFSKTKEFRQELEKLDRDDLLEIIRLQDPELIKQINRIEWVLKINLVIYRGMMEALL